MTEQKSMVFFDIDGTIFETDKGTPESTRRALRLLKERGHIPVVCTGRPRATIFPEIADLGFSGFIGGAGTYVEYEGTVIRNLLMDAELLKRSVKTLNGAGCHVVFEGPEYLSYQRDEDSERYFADIIEILRERYPFRIKPLDPEHDKVNKLTIHISDPEQFEAIKPILSEDFHLICYKGSPYAEMTPKGINKADGIHCLLQYLGIPRENTYAFGDGPNDLEMLQYVQYGTAMGNAQEEVLAVAPYRTKSLWEDGVYHALEEYGLI